MQSLSVDKTTLSRLISVVNCIPVNVIDAIGPAHDTGRDRWIELANLFHEGKSVSNLPGLLSSEAFQNSASDARFQQVMAAFDAAATNAAVAVLSDRDGLTRRSRYLSYQDGTRLMKVTHTDRAVVLSISNQTVPGFADYLLREVENLYAAFTREKNVQGVAATTSALGKRDGA